jgi:phage protein D
MAFETSQVRHPKAFLVIDGARLLCKKAEVSSSSTRKSDSFSAEFSLGYATDEGFDISWWADQDTMDAQVIFTTGVGDTKTMITGQVDEITLDLVEQTVSVKGRDKSAKLSEKRRSQKFNNQKASDIVSQIAADNGFSPVIETSDDDAGKQYHKDTVHLALNGTDFETLSSLAEREGCKWFVSGDQLYFIPKDADGDAYEVHYREPTPEEYESGNFIKLNMSRNLRAAKSVKVKVKSWHHKDAKAYEHTAEASGGGEALEYEHHIAMANQEQVEKVAKSKLKDVIRHEMNLSVTMPGDLAIDPTQKLALSGTGTQFDQEYDIDHVKFSMSYDGGFEMEISTKAPKKGRGGGS